MIGTRGVRLTGWARAGVAVLVLLQLAAPVTAAAQSGRCVRVLRVELTPDVPRTRDLGFLSSLLGDHPGYALTYLRQRDGSVIEVRLAGPGPDYACDEVVEAIGKDSRVLSVTAIPGG